MIKATLSLEPHPRDPCFLNIYSQAYAFSIPWKNINKLFMETEAFQRKDLWLLFWQENSLTPEDPEEK